MRKRQLGARLRHGGRGDERDFGLGLSSIGEEVDDYFRGSKHQSDEVEDAAKEPQLLAADRLVNVTLA